VRDLAERMGITGASLYNAFGSVHGRITAGTLAASTVIDGIPCEAGDGVAFFWDGRLMECTLSRDADLVTTISKPDGAAQIRKFALHGRRHDTDGGLAAR
jgi:AcrR family transcriptional regulator